MTRTTSQLRALWDPPCTGPWARLTLYGGAVVSVDPLIVDALRALNACLEAHQYGATPPDCGAYNCRPITGGKGYSLHAYGIAVDVNWNDNPYGHRLVTNMPPAMIADVERIRTRGGVQVWRWGGRYSGNKDAMHFEVVASPAELAAGLDPATLTGATAPTTPTDPEEAELMAARDDILKAIEGTLPIAVRSDQKPADGGTGAVWVLSPGGRWHVRDRATLDTLYFLNLIRVDRQVGGKFEPGVVPQSFIDAYPLHPDAEPAK